MTSSSRTVASDFIDHGSETYTFLDDPVVDALMQVVVELGAQSWITRRRLLVLERVMTERGLLEAEAVEAYQASGEDEALWRAERDRLMKTVYAAFIRPPAGGDAAAERAKGAHALRRTPQNPTRSPEGRPPPSGG